MVAVAGALTAAVVLLLLLRDAAAAGSFELVLAVVCVLLAFPQLVAEEHACETRHAAKSDALLLCCCGLFFADTRQSAVVTSRLLHPLEIVLLESFLFVALSAIHRANHHRISPS